MQKLKTESWTLIEFRIFKCFKIKKLYFDSKFKIKNYHKGIFYFSLSFLILLFAF